MKTSTRFTIAAGLIAATAFSAVVAPRSAAAQPQAVPEPSDRTIVAPPGDYTIAWSDDLAPILKACMFADSDVGAGSRTMTRRDFTYDCVVPYINGLWLSSDALLRTHGGIAAQATDKLITHPKAEPFPIFYPPQLGDMVLARLHRPLATATNVVAKPLPPELPPPSLAKDSLYNNVGLLYLPNPYVVPGGTFNEMYGWDSFFIIKGMLASIDYIMSNPTARLWSVDDQALVRLSVDSSSDDNYRAHAARLFQVAKGMVDNHIFEIAYYGGLVLNANRTYYLTRSQPPLFTQEALAVVDTARRYGFPYQETLAPYLTRTRDGFTPPETWQDWIRAEVLPAAETYYRYWTDPEVTRFGSPFNPRVASVTYEGRQHDIYLFGTDGVGPAPEVARSTQPQNRELYASAAAYFAKNADRNPDRRFYNETSVCAGQEPTDGCGDADYKLTQAFYRADRAMRASGYDLSGRFGEQGEWTMDFAPMSLNVLLLQMAADIDRMAELVDESERFGAAFLSERRAFIARFFARPSGGYGDRFAVGTRPDDLPLFTYQYATQFYLLWGGILEDGAALIRELGDFLGTPGETRFGIPTSLRDTGKQWDWPYAWAPIQFFAGDGLAANGDHAAAARVMDDWIAALNLFFARTGVIIEKYDYRDPTKDPRVKIGYSETQRGFGWTNAVYLLFVNRLYERL